MNDSTKKNQTAPQEEVDERSDNGHFPKMVEIINVFHKYLPDKIPEVELVSAPRNTIGVKRNATLSVTSSGKSLQFTLPEEMPDEIHDVLLLFRFFSKYREDKKMNLWISGLPWKFNAAEFYREYAHQLGHPKTKIMLQSIGFSGSAIKRYKTRFPKRCDAFQKQIIKYAKENNVQNIKLKEFLVETKSDVTLKEIKEWKRMRSFKPSITITTKHKNHESIRISKI